MFLAILPTVFLDTGINYHPVISHCLLTRLIVVTH